jgi:hypothetical protein
MTPLRRLVARFRQMQEKSVQAAIGQSAVVDQLLINQARILARMNKGLTGASLQDYEFKIFSQWGEDGIIQFLISEIELPNKTFIEFGVESFTEANCRLLLMLNNWSGYVIDGSAANVAKIVGTNSFWRHQLTAQASFITAENINELLDSSRFDHDLGLLSVDIDGVDYWVWKAINRYRARIVVVEYNAVFGSERQITVPYDKNFYRTAAHPSNLYFGASLPAMVQLGTDLGYTFVGANSNGVNAFFVRTDLLTPALSALAGRAAYVDSKARESRDLQGRLTYLNGAERLESIRGLPVVNTENMQTEVL